MRFATSLTFSIALIFATSFTAEARGGGHSHSSTGGSHTSTSEHYTSGYLRSNGTYVSGYHATNPNGTRNDNFSTRGNVNPYTGEPGTKPRDEDLAH